MGSHFHRDQRFPRPPLSSRTVGFPESGWRPRLSFATFPMHRENLSVHPHTSSPPRFVANLDTHVLLSPFTRHRVLMGCPRVPAMAESRFAPSRRYLSGSSVDRHLSRRYPAVIAHTDSCANPGSSANLHLSARLAVCAGCCEPLLQPGPSRRYLCSLCIGAWIPTPQCSPGA